MRDGFACPAAARNRTIPAQATLAAVASNRTHGIRAYLAASNLEAASAWAASHAQPRVRPADGLLRRGVQLRDLGRHVPVGVFLSCARKRAMIGCMLPINIGFSATGATASSIPGIVMPCWNNLLPWAKYE